MKTAVKEDELQIDSTPGPFDHITVFDLATLVWKIVLAVILASLPVAGVALIITMITNYK